MSTGFSNWSGFQRHDSARLETPGSVDELAHLLEKARVASKTVRAVGSGHSFVPFWTDDFVVSLDNMRGIVDCDESRGQATVMAGSKLHELGEPLWQRGLAMRNMGDIDRQSIAGAIGTGTHGTGRLLGNLSSQVAGLKLMTAAGELLHLTPEVDPELFSAAQVSLGSLGIVTEVTLALVPSFYLHEQGWMASVDECGEQLDSLIEENRHFEFFWLPQSDECMMKTLNVTDREETLQVSDFERFGPSYGVFPSAREPRFNEIEFALPAGQGWDCFLELRAMMRRDFPLVRWPLEFRTVKADDIMLSPANGRETVTISAHEGVKRPFDEFFLAVENVFRRFGGRPHWGKIHTHDASELEGLLPEFERFCRVRERLDPEGRFLNPFLSRVFGIH